MDTRVRDSVQVAAKITKAILLLTNAVTVQTLLF